MFKIECKKEFQMPLKVPSFSERYQIFLKKGQKKKIIYFKNEFDNTTFRYRCYNFTEALYNSKNYDISYFLCSEIPLILKHIKLIDLIIFQRTSWTKDVENLIYLAKYNNIKIVYDMDDLLYKIDYIPMFINNICQNFCTENISLYLSIAGAYELVANKCDAFITTTPFLQKKLKQDFNKPTFVIPNFLNNEQMLENDYILVKRKYDKSKFIIGYFSGSPSHKGDFHSVENDLIRLLDTYNNIYLKIVGFMELTGKLREYWSMGRVILINLVPYQQLPYEIGSVDVNIIPLNHNDFNESKSELKYFEASILKIPSCITKTKLYDSFIEDGKNGIFCEPGEWYTNLKKLYLNKDFRESIGENAYKTTMEKYLPIMQKENIESVYDNLLNIKI